MGAVRIYKETNPANPRFPWQSRVAGCESYSWLECADEGDEHEYICTAYPSYRSVLGYLNDSSTTISRHISK